MSDLKLTDREWQGFFIGGIEGIFQIKATKSGIDKNKLKVSENGKTPYITRSDMDNGINLFVSDEQMPKYKKDGGNVITIGLDTQTVFYQKNSFWTGQNIQVLSNDYLNYWVAVFVIPLLKIQMKKFAWGSTGATLGRLSRTRIMLPVNSDGLPDWRFMEDFIKQKEQKQIADLKDYYSDKAVELMISTGSLKNTQWREFYIRDYFEFIRGNQNNMAKCKAGYIPLISAKKVDNGYKDFIAPNNKSLFPKHILTLNNDGDGGVGIAYYQPVASALDTHVTALLPKIELSRHTLLFVARSITHQRGKFSHGYSLNNDRLRAQKILLPVNSDGSPDWQFMEDFMKQIEQNKIAAVLSYYNNSLNNNSLRGGGVERWTPSENRWAAFAIQDICEIHSGVRLTKQDMQEGKIPFVGASDSNNGITAFIANTNASLDKDILGVNYNGSVVENFYHPYECLFSDDVKRLKIKSKQAGKYAYLFLKTMILKQKSKYQYGYKFNATRMAKQKILLPVDASNQPDWINIERFMQQMELEKIICYLKSKSQP